jgi:mono/diheme cytochrome c family protein
MGGRHWRYGRDQGVRLNFRLLTSLDRWQILISGIVSLVAICASGCGPKTAAPDPKLSAAGLLFQKNCATCHGPNGDGQTIADKVIPSLKIGKPVTDPDSRLTQQITNGGNGMPPFKYTLTDDEIQQLLRYVRGELQQPKKKL